MTPYSTQPVNPFSGPPFSTAVGRLIIANVAVFFLQQVIPAINMWFALTPRVAVEQLHVWQIVSYMFLHGGFWHLFFNMLVLWFVGSMIEPVWGARKFMRYYLACGIGGGLLHILLQYDARCIPVSPPI